MTLIVTAYLRFFSISTFDTIVFATLTGSPFVDEVSPENALLTIETTTSQKNNWESASYIEKYGLNPE
jgi:hypothetical protein